MPYRLASDILEQMRPAQLVEIEEASPHLAQHTDGIWQRHTLSEFTKIRKAHEAGELKPPKSWRTLYLKSLAEREQALAELGSRAKARYAEHRAARSAHRLVVTDAPMARMPGQRSALPGPPPKRQGAKMLSKARSAVPVLRAPRKNAATTPGPKPGPASPTSMNDSFLSRWSAPDLKTHAAPPQARPKLGEPPHRTTQMREGMGPSLGSSPTRGASAAPLSATAGGSPRPLNHLASSSKGAPRMAKRKQPASPVTVVTVTKKRPLGPVVAGNAEPER